MKIAPIRKAMSKFPIPSTVWFVPKGHLICIKVNLENFDPIDSYTIDEPFYGSVDENDLFNHPEEAIKELRVRAIKFLSDFYDTDDYETVKEHHQKFDLLKFRAYQIDLIRQRAASFGSGFQPAFPKLLAKAEGKDWHRVPDIPENELKDYISNQE